VPDSIEYKIDNLTSVGEDPFYYTCLRFVAIGTRRDSHGKRFLPSSENLWRKKGMSVRIGECSGGAEVSSMMEAVDMEIVIDRRTEQGDEHQKMLVIGILLSYRIERYSQYLLIN
jgi:hypothetical protein